MNKSIKMSVGVGASSLIMIFVVLAAVTLATLALGTAHADYKLAKKSAEGVTRFYEADNRAEEILALIDDTLRNNEGSVLREKLMAIPEIKLADKIENRHISYQVAINDKQVLNVVLETSHLAQKDKSNYKIVGWYVENNSEWAYDEGLRFEDIIIEE